MSIVHLPTNDSIKGEISFYDVKPLRFGKVLLSQQSLGSPD